jgi:hypothetical protein
MSDALSTYLHDHLGGAKFAVEMLQTWQEDDAQPNDFRAFAGELRQHVDEDRATLEQLIARLDKRTHSLKDAAGWIAEKAGRYKLSHRSNRAFARHEGLEMLALGILGKLALWDALRMLNLPAAPQAELDQLAQSALAQHARVEARRLAGVREAFAGSAAANGVNS